MAAALATFLKAAVGAALLAGAAGWFAHEFRYVVETPKVLQRELVGTVFTRTQDLRNQSSYYDMQGDGTESWTFALTGESEGRLRALCDRLVRDAAAAAAHRLEASLDGDSCTMRRLPPGGRIDSGRMVRMEHLRAERRLVVEHIWN